MITLYTFGPHFGLPDPSPFVVKALVQLKMSGLPFEINSKGYSKAPKGKLPYLNDGGEIIADSTFIRRHLETKHGIDLDRGLSAGQRATGWALEKMCEEHLYWTIVDSRWMMTKNFNKGPRHFFDAVPAPLRPLIIAKMNRDTKRTLWGQGIGRHARADIEWLAMRDLDAISALLGDQPFLFGDEPHAADASVYGSVASALCPLFDTPIRAHAESKANLAAYAKRGTARWFPELAASRA
ncbi:MAG: glutathione S-transferase family protein [Hyphomicrobium sp.]|nr:glutathione S-transferase family protein [Hyphomicrobium sp.]